MSSIVFARIATATRSMTAAAFIGLAAVSGIAGSVTLAGTAAAATGKGVDPSPGSGSGSATTMYGNPTAAAPYWRHQTYDDCGLMAVADVVGQLTGNLPTEDQIIAVAEKTPSQTHPGSIYIRPANASDPNSGMGVSPADELVLLAHYGVHGQTTDTGDDDQVATGLTALEQYLAGGHRVIASVNAETIWNTPGSRTSSNHALVVTGVDTKNKIVHLNDSGTPDGRDEQVSIDTFVKAWNTSDNRMIVTVETK